MLRAIRYSKTTQKFVQNFVSMPRFDQKLLFRIPLTREVGYWQLVLSRGCLVVKTGEMLSFSKSGNFR